MLKSKESEVVPNTETNFETGDFIKTTIRQNRTKFSNFKSYKILENRFTFKEEREASKVIKILERKYFPKKKYNNIFNPYFLY